MGACPDCSVVFSVLEVVENMNSNGAICSVDDERHCQAGSLAKVTHLLNDNAK